MIATSVAYDLVFLVHVIAAVSTLIVLIVMRWSAQLVARGADAATQQARFPERRNWAARSMHVLPITGLIMVASGGASVSIGHLWVVIGIVIYFAAAGHLEARVLPLERSIGQIIHRDGEANPEQGRLLMKSIDVLLALIAVAFVTMLVQF
jgi:predicted integral membrane protein DUF2269